MSTFGTIIDRIADELDRPDLSARIALAVKTSINHYESERFYFTEGRSALDTIADQEWYPVPDDFQKADIVMLTQNNYQTRLLERTHMEVQERNTYDGYTGVPCVYAVYEEQMQFSPIPDAVYRVELSYAKNLLDLSATADSNAWLTDAEELIRLHSKVDVLVNVIRGPDSRDEAGFLRQLEMDALKQLRKETSRRRATGRIKPWP